MVPCNADIATQSIIRFALEVDPDGRRTLGILTKPDLAIEVATKEAVADLVRGRRRDLLLGYCVVRNRGADDLTSSVEERDAEERRFFSLEPWSLLEQNRLGIPALRSRLRELLMDRTKSELPNVKREIEGQLKAAKQQIEGMGLARSEADQQRAYLGRIAGRFAQLMKFGLDAYYTGDSIFIKRPDLRLITRVREMNEAFSSMFFTKAHLMEFTDSTPVPAPHSAGKEQGESEIGEAQKKAAGESPEITSIPSSVADMLSDEETPTLPNRGDLYSISFRIPTGGESDLEDILTDAFTCPDPAREAALMEKIKDMYCSTRGYELGTVGRRINTERIVVGSFH